MIEIYGIFFTFGLGVLLHFTYEWSGRSLLISFLAPTNESVFEHLKLLLTPFLLWSLNEYVHYGQFTQNFIPAKTIGFLAGIVFIVLCFYSYTAICGRNFLPADIGIFAASVVIAFSSSHALMTLEFLGRVPIRLLSGTVLILLLLFFAACSICAPYDRLFRSPYPCQNKKHCK